MTSIQGRAKALACKALLISSAAASLSACSTAGMPKVANMTPSRPTAIVNAVGNEFDTTRPAIRRVRLSGDFFALKPMGGEMPADIANAKVRLDFGGQQPTFDDLTLLLEDRGLSVILGWDDGSYGQNASVSPSQTPQAAPQVQQNSSFNQNGNSNNGNSNNGNSGNSGSPFSQNSNSPFNQNQNQNGGQNGFQNGGQQGNTPFTTQQPQQAVQAVVQNANITGGGAVTGLRTRPLPFRRYEGTLGGLFRQVQRSMGVTIWWNDGIYVSPVGRYSVMLPQNKDLMAQVVTELQAKGASNVVASIQAGTVSFVAPGSLAEEVIRPYLVRLGRNASEVTMQVALVSVVMNEATARGFDWSQFSLNFGTDAAAASQTGVGTGTGGTVGGGTGTGGTGTGTTPVATQESTLFKLTTDATRLFVPGVKLFGSKQPLDITGAIKFLSTYGSTSVDQNVELRTLAGTAVNWRSGETIPYVSGVSATTTGNSGGLGGGGFGGGAIGSSQTEKLETGLTLNLAPTYEANGGLVTVSFKLELTELIEFVQLNAGNQLGSFTQPRTREQKLDDIVRIPVGETVVLGGLRRQLSSTNRTGPFSAYSIGSKSRNNEVQTIFVILRPSVTTYEVSGLDQPLPAKLNSIELGSDGRPWQSPSGEYRGTNMFGEPVNTNGPERRRAMSQPNKGN